MNGQQHASKRRHARHTSLAAVAALALGLTSSACGAANEAGPSGQRGAGTSGTVDGAGSSAQQAAQEAWRASFQETHSAVTVNYNPTGSGAGREQFIAGGSDFAGSDTALNPSEIGAAKKRCGADAIEVPDYVSPIAIVYNLAGVHALRLDARTLSGIFAGTVAQWNDPAIKSLNKGTRLPATRITPVHRSDSSGTTENFTDYLNAAGTWTAEPSGDWPVKSGEGASGSSGVVAAVKAGTGTIGYVDDSQAGGLSVASIRVGGRYVAPSPEGATKALAVSPLEHGRSASDLAVNVDRTTKVPGAYPLMLTSYLIACPTYPADKAPLVKGYLSHAVSAAGQQEAAKAAGSAPLPPRLQKRATTLLGGVGSS